MESQHESPAGETLESEGFSDTEDALKDSDVESGEGQGKDYDESGDDKVTSAATEPNPKTDDPEGTP